MGGGGVSAEAFIDLSVELRLGLNKVLIPFE